MEEALEEEELHQGLQDGNIVVSLKFYLGISTISKIFFEILSQMTLFTLFLCLITINLLWSQLTRGLLHLLGVTQGLYIIFRIFFCSSVVFHFYNILVIRMVRFFFQINCCAPFDNFALFLMDE